MPNSRSSLAAALALPVGLWLAGCGSPPNPAVDRGADVELALRGVNRALGAATLYVSMGVIATNMQPENIASALSVRVRSETNGCGVPTVSGTTLDVDLQQGCTLASTNIVYTGSLHTTVIQSNDVIVSSDLDLVVDGQPLTGSLAIETSDGNTFSYGADLQFGAVHVTTPNLSAGIASFGAQFDAQSSTIVGKTGTYGFTATGVHQRFGGCYPDDGVAEISAPMLDEFWTFASDAPQTGNVAVSEGSASATASTIALPARTGCPSGPTTM
jgi:hypothetical protein